MSLPRLPTHAPTNAYSPVGAPALDPVKLMNDLSLWLACQGISAPLWLAEHLPQLTDDATQRAMGLAAPPEPCIVIYNGTKLLVESFSLQAPSIYEDTMRPINMRPILRLKCVMP